MQAFHPDKCEDDKFKGNASFSCKSMHNGQNIPPHGKE